MAKDEKSAIAQIVEGATEDAIGAAVVRMVEGGDPQSVVGAAAVGALRGTAKKSATALARLFAKSKADRDLADAVSREVEEHLELVAPIVEENAEQLLEDPEVRREDLASSTAAILVGWERAYRATGDAKKRRVIMAALGNAFRPELFKEGLTLRLFRILEDLDYPKLHFLRTEFTAEGHLERHLLARKTQSYAGRLQIRNRIEATVRDGQRDREMLDRLREHRLVTWPSKLDPTHSSVTWLGKQFLALCADTKAMSRLWPDPDTKPKA